MRSRAILRGRFRPSCRSLVSISAKEPSTKVVQDPLKQPAARGGDGRPDGRQQFQTVNSRPPFRGTPVHSQSGDRSPGRKADPCADCMARTPKANSVGTYPEPLHSWHAVGPVRVTTVPVPSHGPQRTSSWIVDGSSGLSLSLVTIHLFQKPQGRHRSLRDCGP